ncbi:MAG: radical SAM protein, partial [Nitrospirales bacterium]|nr:radical SAM protein [Nitrospirales bacterium]
YLVGGEPGLTPERTAAIARQIVGITSDFSDEAPFIALDTNGTNFVRYADLYKESGINTIQFSLSAADPERDRYFRQTPQNMDSVEMVKEAVKAAKDRGMHCGINMVVWKDSDGQSNVDEIEGVMDIAFSLNMDFFRITPAVAIGAATADGSGFTREEMRGIGRRLAALVREKESGETRIISLFPMTEDQCHDNRPLTCRAGTCFVHVDHEGNLFPCTMVMPHFHAGNALKTDITELWRFSETLRDWRRVAEISDDCASCDDRSYCVSRCPAYAWAAFKTITMEESPAGCR